jgi:hypothetical protein
MIQVACKLAHGFSNKKKLPTDLEEVIVHLILDHRAMTVVVTTSAGNTVNLQRLQS